jgi:hypothetical protein
LLQTLKVFDLIEVATKEMSKQAVKAAKAATTPVKDTKASSSTGMQNSAKRKGKAPGKAQLAEAERRKCEAIVYEEVQLLQQIGGRFFPLTRTLLIRAFPVVLEGDNDYAAAASQWAALVQAEPSALRQVYHVLQICR